MKLEVLQNSIGDFTKVLRARNGTVHVYKYAILDQFQKSWTFATEDFAGMYESCLGSDVSRRWWKRDGYRPKEMMLTLIKAEEQYVREAFKELFNESKNVENRTDRFVFYCDELLRMYKRANSKSIENNHHQDSTIISLYLAGLYPERYTIYPGRSIFNSALKVLHAKESEDKDDLGRFFKLCGTVYQFFLKDPEMARMIGEEIRPQGHLLLVHEYLYFLAGKWEEHTP